MDYLPLKCSLMDGKVEVAVNLKTLPEEYSRMGSTKWYQNQYILLHSKSLLYILNTGFKELTAYIFNEHSIEKVTSYKLDRYLNT